MFCPEGALIREFVAGRLDDDSVAALEAHIEQCEECFMRVASTAGEASDQARAALQTKTNTGSRLERCLAATYFAETSLAELAHTQASGPLRTRIGPYLITGYLGVGGMGIVYRAQHEATRREVALKTVKMPLLASALAMLRQEIEFLCQAQHPSIVAVVDFDFLADEPWYAMELFDGRTLRELNRHLWARFGKANTATPRPAAGGKLAKALRLFAQLCEPVDFIHRAGMVHCDLKPSNVFLRGEADPVLMDFGLASRARGTVGREALVVTGRLRGSLPYIAPEVIRGQIPDTRADLYALGCMLYESVAGALPFVSASGAEIIDMHLRKPPVPVSQLASGVPPDLDALLLRLLAKNPYERFGHASSLGRSLSALADAISPSRPNSATTEIQPTTLFRPPMVGRDGELAQVLECLEKARSSSCGALFLVSGQSGIGKTFFTTEVAQRASLTGIQVITGECVPSVITAEAPADGGTRPLQGFRHFLESLRERCHEHGPTEVDRLFGDRLPVLSNYLPVLRHLMGEAVPLEPPVLPASAGRERIVAAVVDTLVACVSRGPLLLALDDLHWADDLTLAVLERLDDAIFSKLPLVVVANYRSEEAGEAVLRLVNKPWNRELHLGRLGGSDIRALVGGMLSMSAPPEPLVGYIDARAEGIPFFAAEYLRSLVAAGALVYGVGTWSTHPRKLDEFGVSGGGELPVTLQDLIRGRLERLAREAVALLEAGAVLGRRFSVSLLRRMLVESTDEWSPLLATAVAMQVTNSEDSETYTFLHDKIRETLYSGLSEQRRAELHLAAARAIEESSSTPADEYGPIAHHFRRGGEVMRALDYLDKAGAHALAIAANADADRFLGEALELEASLPQRLPNLRRARWLRQRGDALGGLGRMIDSAAALKASAALLGRPFPSNKPDFALKLAREVATQVWHRVRRGVDKPLQDDKAEIHLEVMRVFERMHEVSYYLGRGADLVLSTTASLNASERVGATPSRAIAYSNAAMLAGVLPVPPLADHYFRLAAAAIRDAPDVTAESWVLEMEGHYRGCRGERHQAIEYLERAAVLARQGGFFRRSDEAECVRIGLDVIAGYHAQAISRALAVEHSARKRNDLQIQSWLTLQKGEARLIRDDIDDSLAEIMTAQPLLAAVGKPERIWATGLEAYVRHRRGEVALAHECVERGIALVVGGPPVQSYCVGACDRLAETAVELLRLSLRGSGARGSFELADRACSIVERAAGLFPIARPAAMLHRGSLDLIRRRGSGATVVKGWQQAVAVSQQLALPYQELRLRTAILAHSAEDARAREHGQRVAELLLSLQIEHHSLSRPAQVAHAAE